MHGDGLADDEAICDELSDGLAGVGVGDLADLVGIKPNLALSTADDGGRQALLGGKIDPIVRRSQRLLIMSRHATGRPTRAGSRCRFISSRGGRDPGGPYAYILTDFDVVGDGRRGLSMGISSVYSRFSRWRLFCVALNS